MDRSKPARKVLFSQKLPGMKNNIQEEYLYCEKALEVARLVISKQKAYGDSFGQSGRILAILFPAGIPVAQFNDALAIVRIIDKLFRIATDKKAFAEDPWRDIEGYALLARVKGDGNAW
jgi:hypothetical protein